MLNINKGYSPSFWATLLFYKIEATIRKTPISPDFSGTLLSTSHLQPSPESVLKMSSFIVPYLGLTWDKVKPDPKISSIPHHNETKAQLLIPP